MGKYEKKKKSRKGPWIALVLVLLFTAAVLGVPKLLKAMERENDDPSYATTPDTGVVQESETTNLIEMGEQGTAAATENAATVTVPTEAASPAVSFPFMVADGKLEIESAFQYDGLNPDCENQEGYNIAAITVKNLSETYLTHADITMTTSTGDVLRFVVTDVPAGKMAMAFAVDNASVESDTAYSDVVCEAAFDADASMNEDKITVAVEGIQVILANNTDEQIDEIVVYCRSTLGDQYFGGITYMYTVNNLPAGGTAEVMALDCILGLAEVVRIVINEP